MMVFVACRISGLSPFAIVVPRKGEFLMLTSMALLAIARVKRKAGA
jgi:hypothetical protein